MGDVGIESFWVELNIEVIDIINIYDWDYQVGAFISNEDRVGITPSISFFLQI
jgi:hypothetical protein